MSSKTFLLNWFVTFSTTYIFTFLMNNSKRKYHGVTLKFPLPHTNRVNCILLDPGLLLTAAAAADKKNILSLNSVSNNYHVNDWDSCTNLHQHHHLRLLLDTAAPGWLHCSIDHLCQDFITKSTYLWINISF